MPNIITARRLITQSAVIDYPVLTLDPAGLITSITSDPASLAHEEDTLTAAFLDVHTHGAVGHDVMTASPSDLAELQRFLATRGVAHYLPTTVTASIDDTLRALDSLANAIESPTPTNQATPIGIHLEGPFLSHAKPGVHSTDLLEPPSIALFDRFQSAARGHIKLMTIAPEPNACGGTNGDPKASALGLIAPEPNATTNPTYTPSGDKIAGAPGPGSPPSAVTRWGGDLASETWVSREPSGQPQNPALDLIRHATSCGVKISLGHSNALAADTLAAIAAGATSATHTFNAMRPLDHREPGILGTVLTDPRLFAEIIADGVHVAPALVRLWLSAKGPHRVILVTDSMSATGMPPGPYTLAGQPVTVTTDRAVLTDSPKTLAGSILTLDAAIANLQAFTNADLSTAASAASHNPATMLGLPHLTTIAPGAPANLNRFNPAGRLIGTYLHGQRL